MTILKTLTTALLCLLALIPPALAQPDLPDSETNPQAAMVTRTLHVSPDGKTLVQLARKMWFQERSIRYDPTGNLVSVWEISTGQLKWRQYSPANSSAAISFSSDGKCFVVYGTSMQQEGKRPVEYRPHAQVWTVATDTAPIPLEFNEREYLGQIVFFPDGQTLLGLVHEMKAEQARRPIVKVWNAHTGKLLRTIDDIPQLAQSASWVVNSQKLAVATQQTAVADNNANENEVAVWSLPELALLGSRKLGAERANRMTISPDGKKIAYMTYLPGEQSGMNNEIHLWDLEKNILITAAAPNFFDYRILAIAFSPDS